MQRRGAAIVMLSLLAWGIGYFVATFRRAEELEEVGALAGLYVLILLGAVTIVLVGGILLGRRFARPASIVFFSIFGLAALGRIVHEATQSRLDTSTGDYAPPVIVLIGSAAVVALLVSSRHAEN
jgi:hypothetical protein